MAKFYIPEKLNICFVSFRFQILGRATDHGFLWIIARGLAKLGHSVTVIAAKSPIGKYEIERDGVRVFYLYEGFPNDSHLPFDVAAYNKFKKLHRQNSFDIVHSIDKSAHLISQNKNKLKIMVAYDVNATQMSQIFSILGMTQESIRSFLSTGAAVAYKFLTTFFGGDRALLNSADGVFVTNPQQRVFLERYYLYPDFHIYNVPYGIDVGDLKPKETSVDLKSKLKIPPNAKVIITITDMSDPFETNTLLKAFERVVVKKPNSYLLVVGNGPAWKEIEYQMLNLALGSHVHLLGTLKTEEVSEYISVSDIFISITSRSTGFEQSMIEAMIHEKLIIGSELSPISHIIEDGKDGYLVRPADIDSISHLIISAFSDQIPVLEIGARAKEKVINLFDPKKMVLAIEESYRHILKNRKFKKNQFRLESKSLDN